MKSKRSTRPRLFAKFLAAGLVLSFAWGMPLISRGATQYWDPGATVPAVTTGSGIWDTSSLLWTSTAATPTAGAAYTPGSVAVFAGTGATASNSVNTNTGTDGSDGQYTVLVSGSQNASQLFINNTGFTFSGTNSSTNFATLTFSANSASSTTDTSSALYLTAGKIFNIGTGSDNAAIKLFETNSFSSQVFLGSGATLNIKTGARLFKDNGAGVGPNGGIRFVGAGTVNLSGSMSLGNPAAFNNDAIHVTFRRGDTNTLNVLSGGAVVVSSTGGNANNGSFWVGEASTGSAGTATGVLNIQSGGSVTVNNAAGINGFGLTRTANAVSTVNLSGTLTVPKIISIASTGTFNFNGGTLAANTSSSSFMSGLTAVTTTVNNDSTIDNGGNNITIGTPIGGAAGLAFKGAGTTTFSGTNTYVGATTVNGGVLTLTGSLASPITINSGATLAGTGTTSGLATFNTNSSLLSNVSGSALFANGGVSFSGSTTVAFNGTITSGSTYNVINFGAGALSGTSNLIQTSRGNFSTSGSVLQFTAGAILSDTWNSLNGNWDIGSAPNWINGSDSKFYNGDTVVFDDTPGANSVANLVGLLNPAAVNVSGTTNHTFGGTGSIVGTGTLTMNGSGTLTINTANAFSGGSTINSGTVTLGNAAALSTGTAALNGGNLNINGNSITTPIALGGGNVIGSGTLGGTVSGAGALTRTSGTLVLSAATNTFAGGLNINGGVVSVSSNTQLGGTSGTGGAVTINGGTLTTTNSSLLTNTHVITIGSNGGTININSTGSAGTGQFFIATANTLVGSGSLTVTGNGTLNTTGAGNLRVGASNSYSGNITVQSGGSFEYGVAGAVAPGATFTIGNEGEIITNNAVSNPIPITVTGGSNSVISFENGTTGNITGNITVNGTATIGLRDWYNNATVRGGTISGAISGPGSLVVNSGLGSGGVLTLTGSNSYTGSTTITNSTLVLGGSTSALSPSGTIVNNGVFSITRTTDAAQGTDFSSSAISGTGQLTYSTSGANTLTLTTSNSYSGGTNIGANGGANAVRATASGAFGTGSVFVAGNGGTNRAEISGNATLNNAFFINGKQNGNILTGTSVAPSILNVSGSNTITGNITTQSGGTDTAVQSDAGLLTLSGSLTTNATGTRNISLQGNGNGLINGTIADGTGPVSIIKTGSGTWELAGASLYSGTTSVVGGKLRVTNSAGSATGTGTVVVSGSLTATTLAGTGSISGATSVLGGGRLAPGFNTSGANGNFGVAGTLSTGTGGGGLTLTQANLDFDLSGSSATAGGGVNDLISTSGALTLTGSEAFTFNELNGSSLLTGTPYTLVSGFSSSSFASGDMSTWSTTFANGATYTPSYAINGNALQVTFTAVPEPGTWAMMLGGAGMLLVFRRRRRL